ncbi:low temperature requirement protein A [Nocardia sp. alder85J]|uniref:low temperature requirement protein A n=1 Tax=Nocardia sp. alder85J TaxID=2862949 RepID=UPI001CD3B070|nr:low temperature requirement protein A [Nocardia sp. alder85J]MCX4093715.1 low temperature requirement protein A [Nocardia sp. alder85J]
MTDALPTRLRPTAEDASVTQLELFFDLVMVFAFTQVTDLAAHETTVLNLLRAFLVLAVMWWVWIGYAWLGNVVKADEGLARVALFGAMATALIIALTIPEAFHSKPGGWHGPLVFALGYLIVRLIHLGMFWLASMHDRQLRGQVVRWAAGSITIGTALLIVAGATSGAAQIWLWIAAITGDMLWTLLSGNGWRLTSAGHFAERHGLVIIIALGESIVSIGVGVAGLPISGPIVLGALLGLAVSGLLWWAYFDVAALVVERELKAAQGERRVQIARNCYTYWHFPMVVGIAGLALALKKLLHQLGGTDGHTLAEALPAVPVYTLYGGVALYLLGLVGFRHYATRLVLWPRVLTAAVLIALLPAAVGMPAIATLGLLCAVLVALIAWETVRYAEPRDAVRHAEP